MCSSDLAECLEEMKKVQREENGDIAAPGRAKDDRVIGTGLAVVAWHDFLRLQLAQLGVTKATARRDGEPSRPVSAVARNVQNYLNAIGIERVVH